MSDIVEHLRGSARVLHSYSVVNDCEVTAAAWPVLDRAREEIERLQAELCEARELLEHIDVQLPSWLCAMSDWEFGGDIALESMDSARARIDAFLAKVQP